VAIDCREAADRRADIGARRERGAGGQVAWRERKPGVQVATGLRARREALFRLAADRGRAHPEEGFSTVITQNRP
jgi:hypothetical protein